MSRLIDLSLKRDSVPLLLGRGGSSSSTGGIGVITITGSTGAFLFTGEYDRVVEITDNGRTFYLPVRQTEPPLPIPEDTVDFQNITNITLPDGLTSVPIDDPLNPGKPISAFAYRDRSLFYSLGNADSFNWLPISRKGTAYYQTLNEQLDFYRFDVTGSTYELVSYLPRGMLSDFTGNSILGDSGGTYFDFTGSTNVNLELYANNNGLALIDVFFLNPSSREVYVVNMNNTGGGILSLPNDRVQQVTNSYTQGQYRASWLHPDSNIIVVQNKMGGDGYTDGVGFKLIDLDNFSSPVVTDLNSMVDFSNFPERNEIVPRGFTDASGTQGLCLTTLSHSSCPYPLTNADATGYIVTNVVTGANPISPIPDGSNRRIQFATIGSSVNVAAPEDVSGVFNLETTGAPYFTQIELDVKQFEVPLGGTARVGLHVVSSTDPSEMNSVYIENSNNNLVSPTYNITATGPGGSYINGVTARFTQLGLRFNRATGVVTVGFTLSNSVTETNNDFSSYTSSGAYAFISVETIGVTSYNTPIDVKLVTPITEMVLDIPTFNCHDICGMSSGDTGANEIGVFQISTTDDWATVNTGSFDIVNEYIGVSGVFSARSISSITSTGGVSFTIPVLQRPTYSRRDDISSQYTEIALPSSVSSGADTYGAFLPVITFDDRYMISSYWKVPINLFLLPHPQQTFNVYDIAPDMTVTDVTTGTISVLPDLPTSPYGPTTGGFALFTGDPGTTSSFLVDTFTGTNVTGYGDILYECDITGPSEGAVYVECIPLEFFGTNSNATFSQIFLQMTDGTSEIVARYAYADGTVRNRENTVIGLTNGGSPMFTGGHIGLQYDHARNTALLVYRGSSSTDTVGTTGITVDIVGGASGGGFMTGSPLKLRVGLLPGDTAGDYVSCQIILNTHNFMSTRSPYHQIDWVGNHVYLKDEYDVYGGNYYDPMNSFAIGIGPYLTPTKQLFLMLRGPPIGQSRRIKPTLIQTGPL
jgi:hypothetical protein